MIKNDKQFAITKNKRDEFLESKKSLEYSKKDSLLDQIMVESIISQIKTFDRELAEYEKLKNEKPSIIISSVEKLPEILIKARIVKGLSQNELAQRTGLKEQQIQRYESTNYESANFERILSIAKSMDVSFEDTKAILQQEILSVEGYDAGFIRNATSKLQLKRTLFTV